MNITMKMTDAQDLIHLDKVFDMIFKENRNSLVAYKSKAELKTEFGNAQAGLLFIDGKLCGYSSFKIWQSCIEMMSLIVKKEFRNQGLGFQLRQFVLEKALKRFPEKMFLSLPNKNSINIVRKSGFVDLFKLALPLELRESCENCLEENDFPNCHCQALVFPSENQVYIQCLDYENLEDIDSLAKFYCEIWKESPWNEYFWEIESVKQDILAYRARENGVWLIAKFNGQIVGFMAYSFVNEELMKKIAGHDFLSSEFGNGQVAYSAELGIMQVKRLRGLGTALFTASIADMSAEGVSTILGRTKAPGMERILQTAGFYQMEVSHPNDPGRKYWKKTLSKQ
ncbi:GNAT family N-acetyltransferase [Candidatus Kuenenbacteria bacterium]|nr:GNAT family N-acetyltransferase [Candidatus Kuenenbacteria bacterium]